LKISKLRLLTIREIGEKIRDGETSPTEIASLLVEQIKRTENRVKAYITVCKEEELLSAATERERELKENDGKTIGPLHGLPVSIKDIIETMGVRTTCGSKILSTYVPSRDATVVERLKKAGAILLGKTNTHEFALGGITPPTRNPWDLSRIPGGSSGGSAAALAAASALFSIGSDTYGSIRCPSSLCGTVGLKPTYGRVSKFGVFPECWTLDHVGPMTRRVEDAALILGIIAGFDPLDPSSSKEQVPDYLSALEDRDSTNQREMNKKIGIPKNDFFDICDNQMEKAVRKSIEKLEEMGFVTIEFDFPFFEEIRATIDTIDMSESAAYHEENLSKRAYDFQPDVREYLEKGLLVPATKYVRAMNFKREISKTVQSIFKKYGISAIVTPAEPIVAPKVGTTKVQYGHGSTKEEEREDLSSALFRYTLPFNYTELPAIVLPCGFSNDNLPIGMQIVGPLFDEVTILRIANVFESVTDWHRNYPDI
jgi:aspartyl-tRNA(Asn)/glutamyl-tRNA(Gln) amidotransferase subunit A